jgi:hypothetical protein
LDVTDVWVELLELGVQLWLDAQSKLRIESSAPADVKAKVRACKHGITELLKAQALINRCGIRMLVLDGAYRVAKPPGPLAPDVVNALRTIALAELPLVSTTVGRRWVDYETWRNQQVTSRLASLFDAEERNRWYEALEAEQLRSAKKGRGA